MFKRIFLNKENPDNEYPSYKNQFQSKTDFADDELEELFRANEEKIMKMVEKEITEYLDCDDLCNDDEDMFPKRSVLTGEWYLSDINFEELDYLTVFVVFLGNDLGYPDDYLGLECIFYYDEKSKEFVFDGINSEAV